MLLSEKKILFLMVARGGSKSVPNKNLCKIGNKSLIALRALTALESNLFKRCIISTDSSRIAKEACDYGIEAPFERPSFLATDTASSTDVILHALDWLSKNDPVSYDAVFLAEPSSPFCRVKDIISSIDIYNSKNSTLVSSVVKSKVNSIHMDEMGKSGDFSTVSKRIGLLPTGNRQQHQDQYYMNGCVYLFQTERFLKEKSVFPLRSKTSSFEMPSEYSIEIDEPIELLIARMFWEKGLVNMQEMLGRDL